LIRCIALVQLPAHQLFLHGQHKPHIQIRLKNSCVGQSIEFNLTLNLPLPNRLPVHPHPNLVASTNVFQTSSFIAYTLHPTKLHSSNKVLPPHTHQNHPCTPKPNHTLGNNMGTGPAVFWSRVSQVQVRCWVFQHTVYPTHNPWVFHRLFI
jgi:hypothetical protein